MGHWHDADTIAAMLHALAQAPAPMGLWDLFRQSFDFFTILLVAGSLTALAVIFSCLIEVRERNILPRSSVDRINDLVAGGRWEDLRSFLDLDQSFVGRVTRAALASSGKGRQSIREATELAAAEESARWFRRIDLLSLIGNLGPLIGLAGTVWGMILAFSSLGATGGQAGPAELSAGISKALFHTLLGLCLAIPCLLVYGLYRAMLDRVCTRGMTICSQIVERFPMEEKGGG